MSGAVAVVVSLLSLAYFALIIWVAVIAIQFMRMGTKYFRANTPSEVERAAVAEAKSGDPSNLRMRPDVP